LLEQQVMDLVVLDLGLPRLGGLSVQQEIAAHQGDIPVVIVTGSLAPLQHLRVPCILRKPCSPEQLLDAVRSSLHPPMH
jgi:CheY-like chemotaxis protein